VVDVDALGRDLKVALGRVVRRIRQAQRPGELTLTEASLLARLERNGPASPGVLAESERVRPQAMGNTLAALEQHGLVARTPHPFDGRRVEMSITAAGRGMLLDRRARSVAALTEALGAAFTPAELKQLADAVPLLEKLADHL
jgi:DNA-binding MarR family transcriptional regulator